MVFAQLSHAISLNDILDWLRLKAAALRSLARKTLDGFYHQPSLSGLGKICTPLDRQPPRDVSNMMILLSNERITHEIWLAVFIYLASHDRLMNDLRDSPRQELIQIFQANGELVRKYIIEDYAGRRPTQTFRIPPLLRGK